MTEIEVDFNSRGANGAVRGSIRRAGDVRVGDRVVLIDSSENIRFDAQVSDIDESTGRVLYDVDWIDSELPTGAAIDVPSQFFAWMGSTSANVVKQIRWETSHSTSWVSNQAEPIAV